MNKKTAITVAVILIGIFGFCQAAGCQSSPSGQVPDEVGSDPVETILSELRHRAEELKTYQAQIEYRIGQPLFESETLRTGTLYYESEDGRSRLRLNFATLKQDEEKTQKQIDQYIFDGVWLTHIDYQSKEITKRQLAEPNQPVNAFDMVGRNLPIIGFTKTEELTKEFQIALAAKQEDGFVKLHLKVKPDSVYRDDYSAMDFVIDKKNFLPAEITAFSTEEDVYHIKFLKPKINKSMKKNAFKFKIPGDFGEPKIIPLKKEIKKR